jgi:hypothetical protein
MSGTVDTLYTSFAGPRNLVKRMLPTVPPPFPNFFFLVNFSKREGKGCGRRKKPKVEKKPYLFTKPWRTPLFAQSQIKNRVSFNQPSFNGPPL